jgi:predicted dehydrogenase/threonine dehydrogenase-like Zn-dependent dehydrogenase
LKQVVQNYNTGELRVEEVPAPVCRSNGVVVRAAYSLVSAGTERMKVQQARMSLMQKARARPDKVKQVMQSVKQAGLRETYNKVRERLDSLTPLGYSLAGVVEEVGSDIDAFAVGDRVACAGEGIACHAEFVSVPRNLCVPVPDGVDLKDAAFATVGAIAMNGVRQANVTLGDSVLVVGLGLVGLLGVQLLKAAGCRVIGVDLDPHKMDLARQCGADAALARNDPGLEDALKQLTDGHGVDVAYIAASSKSTDPMKLAGQQVRDRGTVVIVGMVPIDADWQTYYGKEISVRMSRSYGPGRYDRSYEQKGVDYPVGYVRWTEGRNLAAFLHLVAAGSVAPGRLEPEVFAIARAPEAYQQLRDAPGKHAAGLLFAYPADAATTRRIDVPEASARNHATTERIGIGLIGAGNFATGTLIPALKQVPHARLRAICSAGGLSAQSAVKRHGFEYAASDYHELLEDDSIHAVLIATRHDTHAQFAADAMRAGKDVFVEKPLALTDAQLEDVVAVQAGTGRILMPDFNRRFSPLSVEVRNFFRDRSSPVEVVCRVNAGEIKSDSWYQDADEGGWRIVSEGCHFVDLISFLCGSRPVKVFAEMIGGSVAGRQNDNCSVTLKMEDGSLGVLIYVANGSARFEKERIEVFGRQCTATIENFQRARLYSSTAGSRQVRSRGKGHAQAVAAFVDAVQHGRATPIPVRESATTTAACLAIGASLVTGMPKAVELAGRAPEGTPT